MTALVVVHTHFFSLSIFKLQFREEIFNSADATHAKKPLGEGLASLRFLASTIINVPQRYPSVA